MISYHPDHPFPKDGGQLTIPIDSGNYNCRQAGGLIVAHQWSDIDILAYDAENKHLVISESKVRGPKKDVFAYFEHTKKEYGSILEYDGDNYFSFINHLPEVTADGVIFANFKKMVKKLTIQLVSNYVIETGLKDEAMRSV